MDYIILNDTGKRVFEVDPNWTAVKIISSNNMTPFNICKTVSIDAIKIAYVMDCIPLEDIIMGTVHTPNPTITEVMDVVIPEYIMMADLISILNTITTISIILGAIDLVAFK